MEDRNEKKREQFLTVSEIAEVIEEIAPAELQEEWDNSGLLIGFEINPVVKLLTCLEVNEAVVEEAVRVGADMIVSHHPLIFHGVKFVRDGDYSGKVLMDLIKNEISVYSCHTPFDKLKGGNNDIVAELLGLTSIRNLKGDDVGSPSKMIGNADEADIGRSGKFKNSMSFMQVIELVANRLSMSIRDLRAVGELDTEITTVGICTGAGADMTAMAADAGCQLMITGDVKYHEAQEALERSVCLLDAGHYGTEKFFSAAMKGMLEKKLSETVEIAESAVCLDPFKTL